MRHFLLCLLIMALAACGGGQSAEEYRSQAKVLIAQSDYKAATIELKNALRLDPESAETRWLLGKVYLDTGDILAAEKELERSRSLGWNADDVRPALAQTLLAQGKFAELLELTHKGLGPVAASNLLSSKALAELAGGELDAAAKLVARALEKDPQSNYARLAEARLLASQADATGALIVLEEILETSPGNAQAWSLKGDILMQQGALEEARAAFGQSIALSHVVFGDRFKRALLNLQLQDYEAAQADATELLRVAPQHPAANYVQGLIHFQGRDYKDAISSLSVAEPLSKQYPLVLFYLGSAHLMEGHGDQAEVFASRFVNLAPENIQGRKLLATIRLQQGKHKSVRKILQPVLDNNPDDVDALNLMANALLRDGETDQGLDLLARIAALQPGSPVAQIRLGAGLMLSGQGEEANKHLETALELNAEYQQADILLVMNHLQEKDYEGAIKAAQAYQRRNIGKVAPYNVLGRVYLAADRPEKAREAFNRALQYEPGDPSANLSLAQLALAADDPATARQYYLTVLEHHPDNLPTLLQFAALEAGEQNEKAMVARLTQAIDQHPAALEPRLMLARYYLGSGQADQVTSLFVDLDEIQRQSRPVLEMIALAQLSGQQHSVANATLEQLVASSPDTAHYHYLLAMAASGEGDQKKVKKELHRAHQLDANHVPTLVALARLALVEQAPDTFDQYLGTLVELAPGTTETLRLQAIAAQRTGNANTASEYASRAYAQSPSTETLLELVTYQKIGGQENAARKSLQQWIEEHPKDVAVRLTLANDLQVENDHEGAQVQYVAVLQLDPNNVIALNNLAWNLRLEDPTRALEYIRRAAQAAPERAEVLDTLAIIEHLNGENRLAHRNIRRALAAAPGNPSMRYHKAMIEAAMGEKEEAIVELESLLAEGAGEFPERVEAENLLASLQVL